MDEKLIEGIVIVAVLIPSFVIHEYAHGWMANKLGDPTAKMLGRLTLNPLKHIDFFGTILLPAFLIFLRTLGSPLLPIALAKPVPVNFMRLRNPKRSMMYVGMAGPAVNVIIAVSCSLILRMTMDTEIKMVLQLIIIINLILAIFNMVPIPPLDGSRLVMGLLPNRYAAAYSRLEPFGILIVFALLPFGLYEHIVWPVVQYFGNLLGVHNL